MQTSRIRSNIKTELLQIARENAGDMTIALPATITAPLDDTKYNTKIEIVNTIDDLVSNEIEALVDKGSVLLHAVKRFRKVNKEAKLYIVPLADDIDGVKATSVNTFGGTTVSENVTKTVRSSSDYVYSIPAIIGENFDTIATKLKDAINANEYELFTAEYVSPVLTLTAKNSGPFMNNTGLDFSDFVIPGIELEDESFTGGAFAPSLTTVLDEFKNIATNFIVPYENWEEVDDHLKEKDDRDYANGKLFGVFFTPLVKPIADIATLDLGKSQRNGFFITSIIRSLPNVDGTYYDTANLHPLLLAVDAAASANLQIHQNASLQRPSSPNYLPNVGGPNQYMRNFNGTILPNCQLSPFVKDTTLSFSEDKLLASKGLSYVFPGTLYQNTILSQLYNSDLTVKDNPGRTYNQLLLANFFRKLIDKTIQELFSDARISVPNATEKQFVTENIFKSTLADKLVEAAAQYPSLIPQSNLTRLIKEMNDTFKLFILSDGIIDFEGRLLVDQHAEEFKGKVTIATYQQIG